MFAFNHPRGHGPLRVVGEWTPIPDLREIVLIHLLPYRPYISYHEGVIFDAIEYKSLRNQENHVLTNPRNVSEIETKGKFNQMSDDVKTDAVAGEELTIFVERIERLDEEKKAISEDIRDVYAELAGRGFCKKIVRQIVKLRAKDRAERQEEEALLDLYKNAIGME